MDIYKPTVDAIYTKLTLVPGIGRVFHHLRYVDDLKTFLDLYTVPHPKKPTKKLPCVAWITRTGQPAETSWTDNDNVATVTRTSQWKITLLYSFEDDDTFEFSSEYGFQQLVDGITEAFEFDVTLGAAEGTYRAHPIDLLSATVGKMEGTDGLCHRAEFFLRVEHYITE